MRIASRQLDDQPYPPYENSQKDEPAPTLLYPRNAFISISRCRWFGHGAGV